jgi:hypothetical protein
LQLEISRTVAYYNKNSLVGVGYYMLTIDNAEQEFLHATRQISEGLLRDCSLLSATFSLLRFIQ